ncbi:MAG: hypothetical protein QG594_2131 [Bacteroidota bacterium]|nr:hypothetical protein [Bacteroidota bacterium]
MAQLTVIKTDEQTVLKNGRKVYATVSYNKNPDFKWILWLKTGIALSGYNTETEAIERANKMLSDWNEVINNAINL